MAQNPFDTIDSRLNNIENLLRDLKLPTIDTGLLEQKKVDFKFMPIQDIFINKICSKPTFYDHLKKGHFTLYKFGNKSFVDREEFLKAFHKVKIDKKNG